MQEPIRTKLIPTLKLRTAFLYNQSQLQYFNPYNYPKWEGEDNRLGEIELMDVEAAINRCVGYETVPVHLTHRNRFHEEPAKAPDALGVKKKGDLMFRALITWSYEENSLGVKTRRYWVVSPFIRKQRCNSRSPYPSSLTDHCAFRTNSVKKVLQEVLSYPAVSFDLIVAYAYNKMRSMAEEVLETDRKELINEVSDFWRKIQVEDQDAKAILMEWFAHALTGNMEMYIPASEQLVERAKEHLETIKPLHEQIDEANSLVPVFVSQFGDDDVARCYTMKPEEGSVKGYFDPEGFVDKVVVYETASAMPSVIKSKLAAIQINESNLLKEYYSHYNYIPNVGALMLDKFFNTRGKHGMVFLNPTEFAEVFPSE